MSWWGAAGRRRGQQPPPGIDPDLLAIFPDGDTDDPDLLEFAQHLQSLRGLRPGTPPDPGFQRGLRARLLAEARQRRARRFDVGVKLGAGLGMAGVALLAVVAISIALVPPTTQSVLARSRQAGTHDLAPTQAIQLSFNRPMSETAVEAGLRIRPAVPYTATWIDPQHLVIRPQHALTPDVSYVVTIARTAARAADGAEAAHAIVIPFGTAAGRASATPPAPGPRVTAVVEVALADGASGLLQGPGGMLYVSATGPLAPTGARAIRRIPLAIGLTPAVGARPASGAGSPLGALAGTVPTASPSATAPTGPTHPSARAVPSASPSPTPPAAMSTSPGVAGNGVAASATASPLPTTTPPAPPASATPTPGVTPVPSATPAATPSGIPVLSAGPGPTGTPPAATGAPSPTSHPTVPATSRPAFQPRSPSIAGPGPLTTVFRLTPDGASSVPLLRSVRGVTLSPDGTSVAGWADGTGGSQVLEVANTSGARAVEVLARSALADPTAAWLDGGHLLVSTASGLLSVGLDGHLAPVDAGVAIGAEGYFVLAPSGLDLYSVPGGRPMVTNLTTLTTLPLPQLVAGPVWSPDGTHLAYVSAAGGVETLELANADGSDPTALFADARGAHIAHLAYSPQGRFLAFTTSRPGGPPELAVVDTATGTVTTLSARPGMTDPVWNAAGSAVSALERAPGHRAAAVLTFRLSDVGAAGPSPSGLAAAAAATLAQAQVLGPRAQGEAARVVAASARIPAATLFPGRFNRDYVVTTTPIAAAAGTFAVDVHLIRDATVTRPPQYLREQMTVRVAGGRARVTAVTASVLQPVPSGPIVMQTSVTGGTDGTTVFRLQFDADLRPSTVSAHAVSLTVGDTVVTSLQLAFSPVTRTLAVSAGPLPPGPLTLTVGAPLADVDGTPMGVPFHLTLPGTMPSLEAAPPS